MPESNMRDSKSAAKLRNKIGTSVERSYPGAYGPHDEPVDAPSLPKGLGLVKMALSTEVENLAKEFDILETRLGPVMRDATTVKVSAESDMSLPRPESIGFRSLMDDVAIIHSMVRRLAYIIEDLDV